jgi:two-component system osmolarity sensor histidine kinase EnvZ
MVRDLKQVDSDRAVILAGISHDLRTPIARMLLEVEMMQLPDDARRGMQADLAQMEAIISQFLDYARPSEPGSHAVFDLSALLRKMTQEAQRSAEIDITASISDALRIRGNPTDIERMMSNLIENARRYGKTVGRDVTQIDISAVMRHNEVMIEFADHGAGLPDAQIPHLLRPFTRLDSARSQANGAGLGLAIVDRVVQKHHGRLEIKNREGGGLAVRVWLQAA